MFALILIGLLLTIVAISVWVPADQTIQQSEKEFDRLSKFACWRRYAVDQNTNTLQSGLADINTNKSLFFRVCAIRLRDSGPEIYQHGTGGLQ